MGSGAEGHDGRQENTLPHLHPCEQVTCLLQSSASIFMRSWPIFASLG